MFLVVRTPPKTLRPVSHKIGGHKRTTAETDIATDGVIALGVRLCRELALVYS